ncbi:hypothetical protein ML437_01685 [Staphylococcus roterodami]|nr:hypothetical protein ML437_01685 [Staphylococcus roterodami]
MKFGKYKVDETYFVFAMTFLVLSITIMPLFLVISIPFLAFSFKKDK